VKITIEVVEE